MASRITMAPSSVAGILLRAPPNLPTAGRAAESFRYLSGVCSGALVGHYKGSWATVAEYRVPKNWAVTDVPGVAYATGR